MGKMMLELQVHNTRLNAGNRRSPQMQELGLVTLVLKQHVGRTYMGAVLEMNMT